MKSGYARGMILQRHEEFAGSMFGVNCSPDQLAQCQTKPADTLETNQLAKCQTKPADPLEINQLARCQKKLADPLEANNRAVAGNCETGVHVACYNSASRVTISVPKDATGLDGKLIDLSEITENGWLIDIGMHSNYFLFYTGTFSAHFK